MNSEIIHALEVGTIVLAGTLTGSELAVAVFFHPVISRLEDSVHVRAAQGLAKVLGFVMSLWYPFNISADPGSDFRCAHQARQVVVASTRLDGASCPDKCLLPAFASSNQ